MLKTAWCYLCLEAGEQADCLPLSASCTSCASGLSVIPHQDNALLILPFKCDSWKRTLHPPLCHCIFCKQLRSSFCASKLLCCPERILCSDDLNFLIKIIIILQLLSHCLTYMIDLPKHKDIPPNWKLIMISSSTCLKHCPSWPDTRIILLLLNWDFVGRD